MGKIGSFEYPDLTLNEAIDLIRKVESVGGSVSPTGLAKLIGIDPRGAGLHSRIEDLRTYNFVQMNDTNGQLKVSVVGQDILNGNTREAWESFLTIPLYAEMHQRLKGKEPTDKVVLANVLYNITKADTNDIARRANRLKNNYMEALTYLSGEKQEKQVVSMERPSNQEFSGMRTGSSQSDSNLMMDSDMTMVEKGGKLYIVIEKDLDQVQQARSFLGLIEKKLIDAKPRSESKGSKKEKEREDPYPEISQ